MELLRRKTDNRLLTRKDESCTQAHTGTQDRYKLKEQFP